MTEEFKRDAEKENLREVPNEKSKLNNILQVHCFLKWGYEILTCPDSEWSNRADCKWHSKTPFWAILDCFKKIKILLNIKWSRLAKSMVFELSIQDGVLKYFFVVYH